MKKVFKPSSVYKSTVYYFSQRDVTEALGMKVPKNTVVTVQCDGSNKVIVTVYEQGKAQQKEGE